MALFTISKERIELTKAQFEYAKAFRKATFWYKVGNVALNIPLRALAFSQTDFLKFDEEKHTEANPDSVLAHSRVVLEEKARRYAAFRSSINRPVPEMLRKTEEMRTMFEVAKGIRLSRMSLLERMPGALARTLFKHKYLAMGSAAALALFLLLTPAGKGLAVKAGSLYTKDLIASGLYGATRASVSGLPYLSRRIKAIAGKHELSGDIWKDAKEYAAEKTFAKDASVVLGFGGGFALREYFADAAAHWFQLHAPNETLRETIPNTRENLIYDRDQRLGFPSYMPMGNSEKSVLANALTETDIAEMARHSSRPLAGVFERLQAFESGRIYLPNDHGNVHFISDGLTHMKRLQLLEAVHVRQQEIGNGVSADLTRQSMKDLLAERQHALEWIKIFDLKKAAGGVSFSEDHHKSLLCLIAENLTAGLRHNPGHIASGEVLPQEVGIPALPLSQEHLTVESFIDTRSELLSRLRATEKVMDYYGRVIGTDTDEYQALIEAKEAYKKLLSEVEKLAPTFNRLSEVRAEIGIYESHPGEDLTDALLKDRIRQIDFSLYSGHWGAVTNAANHVAQVHPGEVYIDGKIVSLTGAVDFKPDARDHFPPAMGHAIEELNEDFEQQGFHLQVKEGFTPGVYHSSACHYDGTCADIGIGGAQHAYTPEEIYRVFEIAKKHPGISILWENPDPSGFARMQDAYHQYLIHSLGMDPLAAEAKMHHDLKSFSWATAPHFHVHCENCERAGSSLNPLSGTAVNENTEPELAMTGS